MIRLKLTIFLILSWTQLFSQSIQEDRVISTLNAHQVRAILKDHAELVMRREVAKTDSVAYQDLLLAYNYKDSAFRASQFANQESYRVAQSYAEMYHESDKALSEAKKEVRRQKRLKWVFVAAGAVMVVLLH